MQQQQNNHYPTNVRSSSASAPPTPTIPRALHDLLVRLHWVAGTPPDHQICYSDMTYVRRGTVKGAIKRWFAGESRGNNMEKVYADLREAFGYLRHYAQYQMSDYTDRIGDALIAIYETLGVIGRTTYNDDRAIQSHLLQMRAEVKSTLQAHGLAHGIMLSEDDLTNGRGPSSVSSTPRPYRETATTARTQSRSTNTTRDDPRMDDNDDDDE